MWTLQVSYFLCIVWLWPSCASASLRISVPDRQSFKTGSGYSGKLRESVLCPSVGRQSQYVTVNTLSCLPLRNAILCARLMRAFFLLSIYSPLTRSSSGRPGRRATSLRLPSPFNTCKYASIKTKKYPCIRLLTIAIPLQFHVLPQLWISVRQTQVFEKSC